MCMYCKKNMESRAIEDNKKDVKVISILTHEIFEY